MRRLILTGIALLVIVLTIVTAASAGPFHNADYPFTRFSQTDDWCMYYTGVSMCWVPHQYCDPNGKEIEYEWGTLGDCPHNLPASLSVDDLKIDVVETETVQIEATCSDEDNDETTLTFSGWMTSEVKKTDYYDAGEYKVTVSCLDEHGFGDEKTVTVSVENKNRPPVFVEWQ